MSTAAAIPTRQLHPLVTLDYRVRMVSMVVVGLIPLFHFRGRPPLPALVGMAFPALVWPQIAYLIAKNSRDTRRAEFRNLLIDSFLVGGWTAALSFSLFPGAVMVAALNSANLSVGGLRQAAKGLAAILLGMAGDEKKAREAGCDDFDTKPVEFTRLLSKIEGLLQKRKAG